MTVQGSREAGIEQPEHDARHTVRSPVNATAWHFIETPGTAGDDGATYSEMVMKRSARTFSSRVTDAA